MGRKWISAESHKSNHDPHVHQSIRIPCSKQRIVAIDLNTSRESECVSCNDRCATVAAQCSSHLTYNRRFKLNFGNFLHRSISSCQLSITYPSFHIPFSIFTQFSFYNCFVFHFHEMRSSRSTLQPCQDNTKQFEVSTSDTIALSFGFASTFIAIVTIFVTRRAHYVPRSYLLVLFLNRSTFT